MLLPPFRFVAPLAGADGYGQSAEQLALHATDLGADIQFVAHDWQDDRFTDTRLQTLRGKTGERELSVIYFLPFAFVRPEFRARVTVGMTMFETDGVPPFWVPCCNQTNGVIVPSEHCRRSFAAAVDVPVVVAPLGVDTSFYTPGAVNTDTQNRPFVFLMAGLLHYRKGAEFAVRAFREEFPTETHVQLWLKTRRGFLDVGTESLDDPRIEVFNEDDHREVMRSRYRTADCYVACSRGEASGLTPREAMACGTPAIVTDWGGLSELADPAYCYVTGIDGLEPAPPACSSYDQNVAGHLPIGNFCVPSVREIRAAMRMAYEDRDTNREMGERAARAMRAWSWERCATKWLAAIEQLWEGAR